MPVPLEGMLIEEADTAIADTHGFGGPFTDIFAVEEVVLEFPFGDEVGSFAIEVDEHAQGAGVSLLSSFSFSVELKVLDHSLIPVFHPDTLLSE